MKHWIHPDPFSPSTAPVCSASTRIHCICSGRRSGASRRTRTGSDPWWTGTCHVQHTFNHSSIRAVNNELNLCTQLCFLPSWSDRQVLAHVSHGLCRTVIPDASWRPRVSWLSKSFIPELWRERRVIYFSLTYVRLLPAALYCVLYHETKKCCFVSILIKVVLSL